jgi:hypothetical protein
LGGGHGGGHGGGERNASRVLGEALLVGGRGGAVASANPVLLSVFRQGAHELAVKQSARQCATAVPAGACNAGEAAVRVSAHVGGLPLAARPRARPAGTARRDAFGTANDARRRREQRVQRVLAQKDALVQQLDLREIRTSQNFN